MSATLQDPTWTTHKRGIRFRWRIFALIFFISGMMCVHWDALAQQSGFQRNSRNNPAPRSPDCAMVNQLRQNVRNLEGRQQPALNSDAYAMGYYSPKLDAFKQGLSDLATQLDFSGCQQGSNSGSQNRPYCELVRHRTYLQQMIRRYERVSVQGEAARKVREDVEHFRRHLNTTENVLAQYRAATQHYANLLRQIAPRVGAQTGSSPLPGAAVRFGAQGNVLLNQNPNCGR